MHASIIIIRAASSQPLVHGPVAVHGSFGIRDAIKKLTTSFKENSFIFIHVFHLKIQKDPLMISAAVPVCGTDPWYKKKKKKIGACSSTVLYSTRNN